MHGQPYYYATAESQELDFNGVLHRIGGMMAELATLSGALSSSVDRGTQAKRARALQEDIATVCEAVANHHLASKKFELALPAALRCLRTRIALHGEGAMDLVRCYLVLAEVNLGLNRLMQAEESLSNANYILVKHAAAAASAGAGTAATNTNRLRSRMHRNFGRLHAAQGNNAAALESFAQDIYYASLCLGPEHIDVSIGYFFMAQVFAAQARMEAALAFFDKVVDIWYKRMLGARSAIAVALNADFTVSPPEKQLRPALLYSDTIAAMATALDGGGGAGGHRASAARLSATAGGGQSVATADAGATSHDGTTGGGGSGGAPAAADGAAPSGATAASSTAALRLTAVQISEGIEMLDFITRVRETQLGKRHIATGEVRYTMALVLLDAERETDAVALLASAHSIFVEHLVRACDPAA